MSMIELKEEDAAIVYSSEVGQFMMYVPRSFTDREAEFTLELLALFDCFAVLSDPQTRVEAAHRAAADFVPDDEELN